MFCFHSGKVGHVERHCIIRKTDALEEEIMEGQYGKWLRADLSRLGNKRTIQRD